MINKALLCATLAKVREEAAKPEGECLWRQQSWSSWTPCGTAYCFAGWTVTLAVQSMPHCIQEFPSSHFSQSIYFIDGNGMSMCGAARNLLGLSKQEAQQLFSPANNIDDIERIIEDIFNSEEAEA